MISDDHSARHQDEEDETARAVRETDTALARELLDENLEAPLSNEILESDRGATRPDAGRSRCTTVTSPWRPTAGWRG